MEIDNEREIFDCVLKLETCGVKASVLRNMLKNMQDYETRSICCEYFVIVAADFIDAYNRLMGSVPNDKKDVLLSFDSLASMLLRCKDALNIYRNNRVAHTGNLDVSSRKIAVDGKLPRFDVIFDLVEYLHEMIAALFFPILRDNSEKIQGLALDNSKPIPIGDECKKIKIACEDAISKIKKYEGEFEPEAFAFIKAMLIGGMNRNYNRS